MVLIPKLKIIKSSFLSRSSLGHPSNNIFNLVDNKCVCAHAHTHMYIAHKQTFRYTDLAWLDTNCGHVAPPIHLLSVEQSSCMGLVGPLVTQSSLVIPWKKVY